MEPDNRIGFKKDSILFAPKSPKDVLQVGGLIDSLIIKLIIRGRVQRKGADSSAPGNLTNRNL
jgi:hypothetical protein